jgi:hypothetical protein
MYVCCHSVVLVKTVGVIVAIVGFARIVVPKYIPPTGQLTGRCFFFFTYIIRILTVGCIRKYPR